MSTHTFHPDTRTDGLADNCPRCDEHAEAPWFTLDDANLEALVRRTQQWRHDPLSARPRSEAEHKAMRKIEQHLRILERVQKFL